MKIHQVLVTASPGDAITRSALEMRSLFRQIGGSEIYARYRDPRLDSDVLPLEWFGVKGSFSPDDIIVFHASIGEPDVFRFLVSRPERLVVVYHNISPSLPFETYDPAFADLLKLGRRQLVALRERSVLALADSHFNARDLEAMGYSDVRVAPLLVDLSDLTGTAPDNSCIHRLNRDAPVILFVGQLLPHKRPDLLVSTYHTLATYLRPDAQLVMIGPTRLPTYRDALQSFVSDLNLPRVWMTGPVPQAELVALYRRADVFVTMSEHEGFCVPLLEAMAFDVPCIARDYAAIPETLGRAGLLLPQDPDPLLAAEAIYEVLGNPGLHDELVSRGQQRLQDFHPDNAKAAVLENLLSVA